MFVCCRILWSTIVLISISAFFYQCQYLGRHYLSRPVRMKTTMSRQEPAVFPAVTICNQNAFRYRLSLFDNRRTYRVQKMIPLLSHVNRQTHDTWCRFLQVGYSGRERYLPLVERHVHTESQSQLHFQLYKVGRRKPIDV